MNFFRIFIILFFICFVKTSFAEDNNKKNEIIDKAKEITKEFQQEEEVPLNDPFAGDEGSNSMNNIPEGEQEDEMSLYNFKLAGLISGKDNSYISLVNAGGEVVTVTIGQFLGKIKLVDLRLNEAIFEKEDKSFMILDFNNVIREADEY